MKDSKIHKFMHLFAIFIILATLGIGSSCINNNQEFTDKDILEIELHIPNEPLLYALVDMSSDNEIRSDIPYLDDK